MKQHIAELQAKASCKLGFPVYLVYLSLKMMDSIIQDVWEKGIASFLNNTDKECIAYFERILRLVDKNHNKFVPSNFHIAHSYRQLLKTEGLTRQDADRMMFCYTICLNEPITKQNEEAHKEIKMFLNKKKLPLSFEERWLEQEA